MEHNHQISKSSLGRKISRQSVLDECVKMIYPSESDYSNWPPKIPSKEEVEELCKPIIAWLEKIKESDDIFKYNNIKNLAGSSGYVSFRDGIQTTAYCVVRS